MSSKLTNFYNNCRPLALFFTFSRVAFKAGHTVYKKIYNAFYWPYRTEFLLSTMSNLKNNSKYITEFMY